MIGTEGSRMKTFQVKLLYGDSRLPRRAHPQDGGLDLYAMETLWLKPGQSAQLSAGIALNIPTGYVGFIMGRSSMNKRSILCQTGVVDAGYTGELGVILINLSGEEQTIKQGDRIAQLVITPVSLAQPVESENLGESERGDSGFGSTGT
jgi:dUTP pyrophosphatase